MDKVKSECLNCHKVGCHGVRHRMCADKKGAIPKLVTECQWCDARLVVKNKRSWLEYSSMLMLFAPLVVVELLPNTPMLYLALMVIIPLGLIIWAKLGVSYQLAHMAEQEKAVKEAARAKTAHNNDVDSATTSQ